MLPGSRKREAAAAATPTAAATGDSPTARALRKDAGTPISPEEAMAGVLDELRAIDELDPAAERQLLADLQETKPQHYPIVVESFRTALAYRKQLAERELKRQAEDRLAAAAEAERTAAPIQQASHELAHFPAATNREVAATPAAWPAAAKSTARTDSNASTADAASHVEQGPASTPGPAPTARVGRPELRRQPPLVAAAVASDVEPHLAIAANYETPSAPADWKGDLDVAIAELERTVNPQPANIDELHDHMRLRTLLLLAGREEEAYRPIPGTSPAQQDYWSKQLFAMAAYLNSATQLDDKQRAAAALAPLDEARAKLSELATLQIRNLAFVKSVDGFGAYEPRKNAEFKPGEQVTVYAEVENFRSNSTEQGYATSLGTSYQVLDAGGRRVEGGQFPDVADECRNRRRDFHMQYGVALPKNIYPGEYQLELVMTDHLSGKIGQATLVFEIVGER